MGYDLHVTIGDWWDKAAPQVSEDAWRSLVAADVDLRLVSEVLAQTPTGDVVAYRNPLLAEWVGHPSAESVPFDFRRGRIVVNNPDEPTIAKLVQIAAAVGANVQGDDGELYS